MTQNNFDSMPSAVDLLIVGRGPAGIAAAVQAARDGIDTLVVGDGPPGGLLRAAGPLSNLCGFPPGITGPDLAMQLEHDLDRTGLRVATIRVTKLAVEDGPIESRRFQATCRPTAEPNDQGQPATGQRATADRADADPRIVTARAVILATGTKPIDYDVPGWKNTVAAGLGHRDIRSLEPNLSGQAILVVGSGDVAADTALLARQRGAQVLLFHRRSDMKATSFLQHRLDEHEVRRCPRHEITDLVPLPGDGIMVSYRDDATPASMIVHQIIVSIGRRPADSLLSTKPNAPTMSGLFAAGDLVAGPDRFVLSALGTGQRAACLARTFIRQRLRNH